VTVRTPQFTLCDLIFKSFIRTRRHLADVELLVSKVIKVKDIRGLVGYNEGTIHTGDTVKFGLMETGSPRGEILFLVMDLAVEGSLGLVEVVGVLGGANFTLFHLYLARESIFARTKRTAFFVDISTNNDNPHPRPLYHDGRR